MKLTNVLKLATLGFNVVETVTVCEGFSVRSWLMARTSPASQFTVARSRSILDFSSGLARVESEGDDMDLRG